MLFKNPNILFALFALLIPILVHLFQLRRFQKVPFTNVAMLKKLELQTRKSAVLKKWLVLLARLGVFTMLILAFAKPYFPSENNIAERNQETLIYLDNSFSMQAQGKQGALLKNSIQKLLENIKDEDELSIMTNDTYYPKQKGSVLKKVLQNLDYSANSIDFNTVLLQGNQYLKKQESGIHNFILISDFQTGKLDSLTNFDTKNNYYLIKKEAENKANISIEKLAIKAANQSNYNLKATLKNQNNTDQNSTVSLFSNGKLLGKNTLIISANGSAEITFSIAKQTQISGKISIQDQGLSFDNDYYFSINNPKKIRVLLIGENTDYLKRIYTQEQFKTTTVAFNAIDYNSFNKQDLIVINGIKTLNNIFKNNLQDFVKNGGTALLIPAKTLIINNEIEALVGEINSQKDTLRISKINYNHRILKEVFQKQVTNFDYPYSTNSYLIANKNAIIKYANNKSFISEKSLGLGKIYFVASALDKQSSNFKNSPLIVPVFYNIAQYNVKTNQQELIIGKENSIDIAIKMDKDEVLSLSNGTNSFIPQQQVSNNKVRIISIEKPEKAGIYTVESKIKIIQQLAYNYNRIENIQNYYDVAKLQTKNIQIATDFSTSYEQIKSNKEITSLWKWFAILALGFVLLELIFLKFLK